MSALQQAPDYDIAIVGAGMAGASVAAELAPHARVLLAEAEERPGYHATGRSAAFWEECYGGPEVVPLTLASGPFLREHGLLTVAAARHQHIIQGWAGKAPDSVGQSRCRKLSRQVPPATKQVLEECAEAAVSLGCSRELLMAGLGFLVLFRVLLVASIARVQRDENDKPVTPVVINKVTIVRDGQPMPPEPVPPAAPPAAPPARSGHWT